MGAIAEGSDLGGSLRNPANFCNVVGLRPSLGRVAHWPAENAWQLAAVSGPMGRTVRDVALMLGVLAGADARDPLSFGAAGTSFVPPEDVDVTGARVAWSPDLGGLPVDTAVRDVLAAQRSIFEALGCNVDDGEPDLRDADEIFFVLRGLIFAGSYGGFVDNYHDLVKETVRWNVAAGRELTGTRIVAAELARTGLAIQSRSAMPRCGRQHVCWLRSSRALQRCAVELQGA